MINAKFQGAMWQRIGAGVLGLGAFLMLPYPSIAGGSSNKPVTFAKDVAPIFQAKCQECHHPGTAAPMSLVTYEETRPWAEKNQAARGHPQYAAVAPRQNGWNPAFQERHFADGWAD